VTLSNAEEAWTCGCGDLQPVKKKDAMKKTMNKKIKNF
jgi:hypothetical protein